eukprot:9067554-Alexandrium_andersonii.AAC.1
MLTKAVNGDTIGKHMSALGVLGERTSRIRAAAGWVQLGYAGPWRWVLGERACACGRRLLADRKQT